MPTQPHPDRWPWPRTRLSILAVLFTLLTLATTACAAATSTSSGDGPWEPSEDVRLIIHASAGGSSDLMGRKAASILSEQNIVGQTIVPENREGGSGGVAYTYLLSQSGNPHVIATISGTYIATPASGQANYHYSSYDNLAIVAEDASLLAVSADSPYQSLDDLLRAARSDPGAVRFGGTQTGGGDSIVHHLLQRATGTELSYVPFTGGGEANAALLGGNVEVIVGNPAELKTLIDGGRIRPLAVTTPERVKSMNVPTFREQGVDLVFTQARGFIGPPGLTDGQRTYWYNAITRMTETTEWQHYLQDNLLQPSLHLGQDAQRYLDQEWEEITGLYQQLGLGPK
jgi:putative tricarboxylic transport membrane protein